MTDTREVVRGYFEGWTSNRIDDAYALLDPKLQFRGPTASYASAEEFRPALIGFAKMTKGARLLELIVEGDRAAMLYDADLPIGTLRISSFFRVANGKITHYETWFDATELRKVLSSAGRAG